MRETRHAPPYSKAGFFYSIIDCAVKIRPKSVGWFLGDKENIRSLLDIGKKGTVFDANTEVRWETEHIRLVSKRVLAGKRSMILRVRIDGAALSRGEYRLLIGACEGKLTLAK